MLSIRRRRKQAERSYCLNPRLGVPSAWAPVGLTWGPISFNLGADHFLWINDTIEVLGTDKSKL